MPGGLSPQILPELLAFFSILALKAHHASKKTESEYEENI